MLQQAIKKKGTEGSLILHSDQGWQYQMPQYQKKLKENNIINRTLSKWIEQYEEGGASSLESQKRGRKISMNSKQLRYFKVN
ncbi:hypothetical protein EfmGK923_26220 [Enterococcus faecium]|nr:hypothetical protein EfmGK923_26220 [Enterococcus faecium]